MNIHLENRLLDAFFGHVVACMLKIHVIIMCFYHHDYMCYIFLLHQYVMCGVGMGVGGGYVLFPFFLHHTHYGLLHFIKEIMIFPLIFP